MNAFKLLGVSDTADDETILNAYLDHVRRFSPEKHPQQFEKVRAAYEAVCHQRERIQYQLLHHDSIDLQEVIETALKTNPAQQKKARFADKQLKKYLQDSFEAM